MTRIPDEVRLECRGDVFCRCRGCKPPLSGDAFSPRLAVLRDRYVSAYRRCRGVIAIAWRAWRGREGDELILLAGLIALLVYVAQGHPWPDPLPIVLFAYLLLHGRYADRRLDDE